MCVKRVKNLLSVGDKSLLRRAPKYYGSGGHALIGGKGGVIPLDGYGPPIHTPHPPDIGQPWSNSLLDIQGFGQVGGWSSEFQTMSYCAVLLTFTS